MNVNCMNPSSMNVIRIHCSHNLHDSFWCFKAILTSITKIFNLQWLKFDQRFH